MNSKEEGSSSRFKDSDIEGLARIVATAIKTEFDRGGFDSIGSALRDDLEKVSGDAKTAYHLNFVLERIDFTPKDRETDQIRPLCHLAVVVKKKAGEKSAVRFGISPSYLGNPEPCEECKGAGLNLRRVKEPTSLPFNISGRALP